MTGPLFREANRRRAQLETTLNIRRTLGRNIKVVHLLETTVL